MKVPELALVAGSTLAIYVFLNFLIRFFGKRQMAQLGPLDLAVFLTLGSAVETSMVRGSTSLKAGLVAATTLLIANKLMSVLYTRSKRFRRLMGCGPVVIVRHGVLIREAMKKLGLTEEDVMVALRLRECDDLSTVRYAFFETDGLINIVKQAPAAAVEPGLQTEPG